MLRRLTVVTALAAGMSIAAAITLAAPALAKGPSQARITGPGLARAIVVSGNGEPGQPGRLGALAQQTRLFFTMFGWLVTVPPQVRTAPPKASLGPRYTIIYTVPGVTPQPGEQFGQVRQDLFPRAAGGPLVYTPPGQHGMGGPLPFTGWVRASPGLPRTLARLGISPPPGAPAALPTGLPAATHPVAAQPADSRALPWLIAAAAAIAAVALAGTALLLRHRRPATTGDTQPRTSGPAAGSA
ncbi:MAG: hypothetical protein J2P30_01865 [Actinobacteria bacterium]|nr:hypothetical protein [Actinomycetota bacterium]